MSQHDDCCSTQEVYCISDNLLKNAPNSTCQKHSVILNKIKKLINYAQRKHRKQWQEIEDSLKHTNCKLKEISECLKELLSHLNFGRILAFFAFVQICGKLGYHKEQKNLADFLAKTFLKYTKPFIMTNGGLCVLFDCITG